jgi:hypothetical protein
MAFDLLLSIETDTSVHQLCDIWVVSPGVLLIDVLPTKSIDASPAIIAFKVAISFFTR